MSEKPPVSPETLIRMATDYLARHAASTAHLREVLARKIRRRCEVRDLPLPEADEVERMIDGTVERLTHAGLLDDQAYARGKAGTLAAKGWPAWRIRAELDRRGIAADVLDPAEMPELDETEQARRFAERKRLGPFRPGERAPYRDKDIRALVRAGFAARVARAVVGSDGEAL